MDLIEINKAQSVRHPWEQARLHFVLDLIGKNLDSRSPVVIDIGCGDSFFISQVRERFPGGEYYAIDSAFTEEDTASLSQSGIRYYNDFNKFAGEFKGKADIILLLDVIEHIENDLSFLQLVTGSDIMDAGSRLIITVPAFQSLFSQHDVFLKHYRRYRYAGLQKVIEKAGLRGQEGGYFFTALLFPRLVTSLREKAFKKEYRQEGLGGWQHGPFVTSVFSSVLKLDNFLSSAFRKAGIRIPGLSTFIVCKK